MKISFLIFFIFSSLFLIGQTTLILKLDSSHSNLFDSVKIKGTSSKSLFSYGVKQFQNGELNIPQLPSDVYELNFVSKRFTHRKSNLDVVVCSKCANELKIEFDSLIGTENMLHSPHIAFYKTYQNDPPEKTTIQRDFMKALTRKELLKIRHTDFTVQAFFVKNSGLCDISVLPRELNTKKKKIILKGFANLRRWSSYSQEAEIYLSNSDLIRK